EDQDRSDLERQQVIAEEQNGDILSGAPEGAQLNLIINLAALQQDEEHHAEQSGDGGHTKPHCDAAALGMFLFAGVQQHNDKDEQNHDGAGIDDDLYRGDELSAQQQIKQRQRTHHYDERERGDEGIFLEQQVQSARHTDTREDDEQQRMDHLFSWTTYYGAARQAMMALVTMMLAMDSGSRNFHPKPINWS